ncbi:MAG: hypothetical protein ABI539_05405 [Acidobacteriota bacterium]
MSKETLKFTRILFALLITLQIFTVGSAQDLEVTITITGGDDPSARVEGRFLSDPKSGSRLNFALAQSAGGMQLSPDRVAEVSLTGSDDTAVSFKKLIPGEYLASTSYEGWNYRIDLAPPKRSAEAAHSSWFDGSRGLLMLNDILPLDAAAQKAKITLNVPTGSHVIDPAGCDAAPSRTFDIDPAADAVIAIGNNWRNVQLSGTRGCILINGAWQFTDAEAAAMAAEVFAVYSRIFSAGPPLSSRIIISGFPGAPVPHGTWQAETRGTNVTILSGDMAFRAQSLQRLHEQLRHEIFHLWVPNSLALTGSYDWFFEGFALYQALKTGVEVNRLRFADYLDALSRARSIDSAMPIRMSLVDASKNRWSAGGTQVYARGMLIAFLTDLALLQKSGGKRSTADLLRSLSAEHGKGKTPEDGNQAILSVLSRYPELKSIADNYVNGTAPVDWSSLLTASGLEESGPAGRGVLKVSDKLSGKQKEMLDKLGYNNWRKISPRSK